MSSSLFSALCALLMQFKILCVLNSVSKYVTLSLLVSLSKIKLFL